MRLKYPYQTFEKAFHMLLEKAKKEPISMHTFLTTLSGKGKVLLLIFLSLGFSQIPGIAMFLGIFIAYLGIRIAMGKQFIWMPKFLLYKKIPSYFLVKFIGQIIKMLKFFKRGTTPRFEWAVQKSSTRVVNGLVIALVGVCLAASPPAPLTGMIASVAIFLIGIGLLNDDGIYIVLSYFFALLYLITVGLLLKYFSLPKILGWIKDTILGS